MEPSAEGDHFHGFVGPHSRRETKMRGGMEKQYDSPIETRREKTAGFRNEEKTPEHTLRGRVQGTGI